MAAVVPADVTAEPSDNGSKRIFHRVFAALLRGEQQAAPFTTATRPVVTTIGAAIFDTTLGKPVWWNGTVWKDATGTTV